MKMITGSLAFFACITAGTLAAAPEGVAIRSVTATGSGCPPFGSTARVVLDEDQGLVLSLPTMLVEWGPAIEKVRSRKNCMITLDMAVPEGWQYALGTWENRGFVQLDPGLRAEVSAQYLFEGGPAQRLTQTFHGPFEDSFQIRDLVPLTAQIWSSCVAPRKFNINTLARIMPSLTPANPEAQGMLELGSHWEENIMKMQLSWRRCQG